MLPPDLVLAVHFELFNVRLQKRAIRYSVHGDRLLSLDPGLEILLLESALCLLELGLHLAEASQLGV